MALTAQQEQLHADLVRLKEKIENQHLGKNNVIGVGVGFKEVGGQRTNQLAIRFYVQRKGPVAAAIALPTTIDGMPTDVIEADFKPHQELAVAELAADGPDTSRYNTLVGGISIAPSRLEKGAGTLGIMVTDVESGEVMMLSNYHVLCLDDGKMKAGDEICQEAKSDNAFLWCGNCAELTRWYAGNYASGGKSYGVDAAVAKKSTILRGATAGQIQDIGLVAGTTDAVVNMRVRKRGRTTRVTTGTVVDISATILEDLGVGVGKVEMANQIVVTGDDGKPFSAGGDSGSVYVDIVSNKVVALHWGGAESGKSVGSPIGAVIGALNIKIP